MRFASVIHSGTTSGEAARAEGRVGDWSRKKGCSGESHTPPGVLSLILGGEGGGGQVGRLLLPSAQKVINGSFWTSPAFILRLPLVNHVAILTNHVQAP